VFEGATFIQLKTDNGDVHHNKG